MSKFDLWQRAYRTTGLLGAGLVFAVALAGSASAAPFFVTSPAALPDQNVKAIHLVCDYRGRCYRSGRYVRRYYSYGYNPYYAYGYGPGYYGYGPGIAFGFGGGHHFNHGFGGHGFGGHGFGGHGGGHH